MAEIVNTKMYLERMSKPLQEKLKIAKFIHGGTKSVLDVGCADGTVTLALAEMFPEVNFLGIDLSDEFVEIAQKKGQGIQNVGFEKMYLREMLARPARFDVVLFCSVLHEFYSYGEGISTVVKALSDAHEMLNPGGRIIIRDMILPDFMNQSDLWIQEMTGKIKAMGQMKGLISDFEKYFGEIKTTKQLNHFLLKYLYRDNWQRESQENYVPVSFEQYERIFRLLGMQEQYRESYTIPFLHNLWQKDFDLNEDELGCLRSTGILVSQK